MTPGELIRELRERKGLTQRRLALRAGTSQSAIARIERGEEDVTWGRLGSILTAMGEEPELASHPLPGRYRPEHLLQDRAMSARARLNGDCASTSSRDSSRRPGAARRLEMATGERHFQPQEILETLVRFGVDFVIVGGVAVQAHGYLRGTGDLDVIPRPSSLNLSRLGEALADLDAEVWRARRPVNVTDPNLLRRAPQVPLVTRYGRLDLLNIEMTAGAPASYEDLAGRALVVEISGRDVAVAGVDDLIRMKRAAGREQDLLDIAALARADEELERDVAEGRRWHGPRRPLPRHRRLLAQPAARAARHADPARRRPAARRLRGGHSAPADALGRSVELEEVFITHFHADHVLGLPGMLKTFALRQRERQLTVYGPRGLRRLFDLLAPVIGRLTFRVELVELEPNEELERDGYRIAAFEVEHGGRGLGYALVEETRPGVFDPRVRASWA